MRVLSGWHAADMDWGSPAIAGEAELGDPLIRPARDDRLAGGVAGRVIVEATAGARLRVAARPDAHVDRIDWWRVGCQRRRARNEGLEDRGIEAATGEGGIQAAPAAAVDRLQA